MRDGDVAAESTSSGCSGHDSGHDSRQVRANFVSRLSRMQTARASISMVRSALDSMAWTKGTDALASDADAGIRLTRWMAGPATKNC